MHWSLTIRSKLRVEEEDEAVTETFTADKENIEATPSHNNTVLCGREKKPANSHCADETQEMHVSSRYTLDQLMYCSVIYFCCADMQQVLLDLDHLVSPIILL